MGTRTGNPKGRPPKFNLKETVLPPEREESEIPEPFSPLGEDGMRTWKQVWQHGGHLEEVDSIFLTQVCLAVDEMEEMRRSLALGITPKTYRLSNGTIMQHPYVGMVKDMRTQINGWLSRYGFGPSERQKLKLTQTTEDLSQVMKDFEAAVLAMQDEEDNDD